MKHLVSLVLTVILLASCRPHHIDDSACRNDITIFHMSLDQDYFLDAYQAFQTGDIYQLPSAQEFSKEWDQDHCPSITQQPADVVARRELLAYYQFQCKRAEVSPEIVEKFRQTAQNSNDAEDIQVYLLARLCLSINQGNDPFAGSTL